MGVALVAAVKGYKCVFTMPDKMSTEKINRLKALGAQVVVTPTNVPAEDPEQLLRDREAHRPRDAGRFYAEPVPQPRQHRGPLPVTGPEIWEQTDGKFDVLRRGPGHRRHDERRGQVPQGEEPEDQERRRRPASARSTRATSRPRSSPSRTSTRSRASARTCSARRWTSRSSTTSARSTTSSASSRRGGWRAKRASSPAARSGAAVHVAVELAKELGKGKTIVTVLPDGGSSYISKFYNDEWMRDNGFLDDRRCRHRARRPRRQARRRSTPRRRATRSARSSRR